MAGKKAPARKSAAPSGAAAARSEAKGEAKTATFRDLTLSLPPTLPASVAFDFMGGDDDPSMPFRVMRDVLGDDQYQQVRDAVTGDSIDNLGEIVSDLLNSVLEQYGLSAGK